MNKLFAIAATLLLIACSDDPEKTVTTPEPEPTVAYRGCLASLDGVNQICATQTGREDFSAQACDSLANAMGVRAFFPTATFAAVENCPAGTKECNYSYTDTTTQVTYAGRGYFFDSTSLQGTLFCAAYGVAE